MFIFDVCHNGDNDTIIIELMPNSVIDNQQDRNNTNMSTYEKDCICLDDKFWSVDGLSWKVVFTENRYNPYLSFRYDGTEGDLSDIESIVRKNGIDIVDDDWLDNHVLEEVDTPPVLVGGGEREILSSIIAKCFEGIDLNQFKCVQSRIPFDAEIIIDRNGNALFKNLSKSTGIMDLDNRAIMVGKEFCKYTFTPALHRGKKVLYLMRIAIMKEEWLPYIIQGSSFDRK